MWTTGSKVIICLVMVIGRHRGLPESIDPSVRLPSITELTMARWSHKKLKNNSQDLSDSEMDRSREGEVVIDVAGDSGVLTDSEITTKGSKEKISSSANFSPLPIRSIRRHASLDSISLPSARRKSKERPSQERVPFDLEKRMSQISLGSNHTVRSDLGFDVGFLDHFDESSSSEEVRWTRRAYSLDDADRVEYN